MVQVRPVLRLGATICAAQLALTAAAAHASAPAEAAAAPPTALRVCADPDNLPFSNERGEGLENRVAEILAADLHLPVQYTWQSQRRGFLRRSLNAGVCDVVMGVPPGLGGVAETRPYYRSAYVFLTRSGAASAPRALDDPALKTARIGLHALGMEGANTPAANALAVRGITANVQGFSMWGEDDDGPMAGKIVDAVARNDIDVAIVWGPFAGYFGKKYGDRLALTPILADACLPDMPFAYDIALGVRVKDEALRQRLQGALDRRHADIDQALRDFAIPLVRAQPAPAGRAPVPTGGSPCAPRLS